MKKKTIRNLFIFIFVVALILGWMIPKNFWQFTHDAAQNPLHAGIYDVPKRMGQLDQETPYYKYLIIGETLTGGAALLRVDDKVPMHIHKNENHFVYIYKGKGRVVFEITARDSIALRTVLNSITKMLTVIEKVGGIK